MGPRFFRVDMDVPMVRGRLSEAQIDSFMERFSLFGWAGGMLKATSLVQLDQGTTSPVLAATHQMMDNLRFAVFRTQGAPFGEPGQDQGDFGIGGDQPEFGVPKFTVVEVTKDIGTLLRDDDAV